MEPLRKTLSIHTSPHIASGADVARIMRHVIYALLPVCGFAIYAFGWAALLTLVVAVVVCWLSEVLFCRLLCKPATLADGSVTITGILFALTLPPGLPLWMTVVGAFAAVGLGKFLFGGLAANVFNPALVGRAFLQAAFPGAMTTWSPVLAADRFSQIPSSLLAAPFMQPNYDTVSSASPLALLKFEHTPTPLGDLFLGTTAGSLGETSSLIILLGGAYLIARGMMSWRIPAGILVAVAVVGGISYVADSERFGSPLFMLFSGGLMLGAMFMATDPVSAPVTHRGCFVYGLLIGLVVVVIRNWGGLAEGVMYAILFANAVSPHIDNWLQPLPFGRKPGHGRERGS